MVFRDWGHRARPACNLQNWTLQSSTAKELGLTQHSIARLRTAQLLQLLHSSTECVHWALSFVWWPFRCPTSSVVHVTHGPLTWLFQLICIDLNKQTFVNLQCRANIVFVLLNKLLWIWNHLHVCLMHKSDCSQHRLCRSPNPLTFTDNLLCNFGYWY